MRPEYDFSKGVRGKHAGRYAEGTNVVVLEPDVAREFSTTEQVNETLRAVSNCFNNIESAAAARRHNTAMNRPPLQSRRLVSQPHARFTRRGLSPGR